MIEISVKCDPVYGVFQHATVKQDGKTVLRVYPHTWRDPSGTGYFMFKSTETDAREFIQDWLKERKLG